MSARQYADWKAHYAKEPRGERREDFRAASICATMLNAAELMRSGRTKFRFTADQFLLVFGVKKPQVKEEKKPVADFSQMKMAARMWAAAVNADEKKAAEREARIAKRKRR